MSLWDEVAEAISPIVTVVDWASPTQQVDLPVAYYSYAGHERPTSAGWKEKVAIAVIAAFAQEADSNSTVRNMAADLVAAIEAMPTARLLEIGARVELATPTSDKVVAYGLELVVIEA